MRELALLPLLAACAPARVPVDVAERECFARATSPRTGFDTYPSVGIGIGTGGYSGVGVGLDLAPRRVRSLDPGAVYNRCVYQKTGLPPRAPLSTKG